MAVRIGVFARASDADLFKQTWEGLGFKLVDVGALPTGSQYFETPDPATPLHDHASRYVMVMSDSI